MSERCWRPRTPQRKDVEHMPRWLLPLLAAVLTSGAGTAINVATDLGSVVAWVVVGVLTLATGVVTVVASPAASDRGGTRNSISGTAVQARDISASMTFTTDRSRSASESPTPE
jgi:hypothetical protein